MFTCCSLFKSVRKGGFPILSLYHERNKEGRGKIMGEHGPGGVLSEKVGRGFLDVIALGVIDAGGFNFGQDLAGLDVFSDRLDAEAPGECGDASHDLFLDRSVPGHVPNELTVHLEKVDAEHLDVLK